MNAAVEPCPTSAPFFCESGRVRQEHSCLESTAELTQEPRNTQEFVAQDSTWCFQVFYVAIPLQLTVLGAPMRSTGMYIQAKGKDRL